jgi:hypothetical protein
MAELDEVLSKVKEMSITDLSILNAELGTIMQSRALAEIEAKERELNELRGLAGLKRKPIKKPAVTTGDAPAPANGRRGRPAKNS